MTSQRIKSLLFGALCLALFFRGITAFVVYGPQAVDDYSHGLIPTFEMLKGTIPDIPLWRSPLLIWSFYPFAKLATWMGLSTSFDIFRVILMALAVFSLWGIWAFGQFVLRRPDYFTEGSPIWAGVTGGQMRDPTKKSLLFVLPLGLLSLHGVLSFAVTRAFGESIAITSVLVALLWMDEGLDRKSWKNPYFWAGSILLGLSCLYRFQIGVLAVGYAVYLLATRRFVHFGILAVAGLVAALVSGIVDMAFGRFPLETLYNYFYVNRNGAVEWSVQPWYNTWNTALGLFLFPFSLPFWKRGFSRMHRWEKLFLGLLLFFVFMHSLIPHKEERFLYPIAPLLLILLGRVWAKSWGMAYEKYFFRPVILSLLAVVLVLFSFSNSQSGEYEPILRADRMKSPVHIWDVESLLGPSFFRERLIFAPVEYAVHEDWPSLSDLELYRTRNMALLLVTSNEERLGSLRAWSLAVSDALQCSSIEKIQSPGDRLLYAMNPKYNVRRKPSWISLCRWR